LYFQKNKFFGIANEKIR